MGQAETCRAAAFGWLAAGVQSGTSRARANGHFGERNCQILMHIPRL